MLQHSIQGTVCPLLSVVTHTRCSYCHYHLPYSIDYHCRIAYDDISTLHVILSQVGYSLWHLGLAPFYVLLITQHSTDSFLPDVAMNTLTSSMDLIRYLFAPLIIFRVASVPPINYKWLQTVVFLSVNCCIHHFIQK